MTELTECDVSLREASTDDVRKAFEQSYRSRHDPWSLKGGEFHLSETGSGYRAIHMQVEFNSFARGYRAALARPQPEAKGPVAAGVREAVGKLMQRASELRAKAKSYEASFSYTPADAANNKAAAFEEAIAILSASTTPPAEAKTPDAGVGTTPQEAIDNIPEDARMMNVLFGGTLVVKKCPAQPAPAGEDETGVREAGLPISMAPRDGTPIIGFGAPSTRHPEDREWRETRWTLYGEGSPARAAFVAGNGLEGYWSWSEPQNGWGSSWEPTRFVPLPSARAPQPPKAETPAGVGDNRAYDIGEALRVWSLIEVEVEELVREKHGAESETYWMLREVFMRIRRSHTALSTAPAARPGDGVDCPHCGMAGDLVKANNCGHPGDGCPLHDAAPAADGGQA